MCTLPLIAIAESLNQVLISLPLIYTSLNADFTRNLGYLKLKFSISTRSILGAEIERPFRIALMPTIQAFTMTRVRYLFSSLVIKN